MKTQMSLVTKTKGQYTVAISSVIMAKSPEMTHDNFTMHLPKPVNLVNFVMASPKSGSPQRQVITININ